MSETKPEYQTTTNTDDCRKPWTCDVEHNGCGAILGYIYRIAVRLSNGTVRHMHVVRATYAPEVEIESGSVTCRECGHKQRFKYTPEFMRRR